MCEILSSMPGKIFKFLTILPLGKQGFLNFGLMSFLIWLLLLQLIWQWLYAPPLPLPTNQIYIVALENYFSQLTWSPPPKSTGYLSMLPLLSVLFRMIPDSYIPELYSPSSERGLQNFNMKTFKGGTPKGRRIGTLSYSCIFISNTHCYFDYKVHSVWFRELK